MIDGRHLLALVGLVFAVMAVTAIRNTLKEGRTVR